VLADLTTDSGTPITQTMVAQVTAMRDEVAEFRDEVIEAAGSILALGIVGDGTTDDTDALETLLTSTIPSFAAGWGPNNNFDVSGVPVVTFPTGAKVRLTRQIVIPSTKAFHLTTPAKYGARIIYEGAQTRTNGAVTSGDNTLTGTGFVSGDVGSDIAVRGAGDGGSTLVTWIQSYTSATSVELAHAPGTTIASGATYIVRPSAFRKGTNRSDTRGIPYSYSNLVFQGGGVCYNNGTKPVAIEGCAFHQTSAPGVLALNKDNTIGDPADDGTGSVTFLLRDVLFNFCHGAVWHMAKTAGLSKYEDVRTNGNLDIPFVLGSGFHELDHVDFQGSVAGTHCNIWISSNVDVGGRSLLNNVRMGSEVFTEGGSSFTPPLAGIIVGPLSGPVVSVGHNDVEDQYDVPLTRPEEIRIAGQSWFGGRAGGPTTTSAKHAIILNKMVEGMSIAETKFSNYYAELINEAWVEANPGTGTSRQIISGKNWFDQSVTIGDTHAAGIFTHGGADWRPQPITQRLAVPAEYRTRQNILPRSNDFANAVWTKTLITSPPTKDVPGPDGVTNSGWTITRSTVGNARVRQTVASGYTAGEPIVFSVWAKAGTHNIMSMGVFATDIGGYTQYLAGIGKPIRLSSRWERYVMVCPWLPSTAGIEVAIHHDIVGGGTTSSNLNSALVGTTILVANAQLEHGLAASAYMDNPSSTIVEAAPFQSIPLGRTRISYGSAAPTTGRHEVGEIVFNTAPAASGTIGWTCVTAGSPGTWKTFGAISA
jgi:hypothetical protein